MPLSVYIHFCCFKVSLSLGTGLLLCLLEFYLKVEDIGFELFYLCAIAYFLSLFGFLNLFLILDPQSLYFTFAVLINLPELFIQPLIFFFGTFQFNLEYFSISFIELSLHSDILHFELTDFDRQLVVVLLQRLDFLGQFVTFVI